MTGPAKPPRARAKMLGARASLPAKACFSTLHIFLSLSTLS